MRIVAGRFRGRTLRTVKSSAGFRPTTDRVREAWFNVVGGDLAGAHVVDLFAGSGALGLEALSRGAVHATFVEQSRTVLQALRANVRALDVEAHTTIVPRSVMSFLNDRAPSRFHVAFADPPYESQLAVALVARFRQSPFADILGVEHAASLQLEGDEDRRYGETTITLCFANR